MTSMQYDISCSFLYLWQQTIFYLERKERYLYIFGLTFVQKTQCANPLGVVYRWWHSMATTPWLECGILSMDIAIIGKLCLPFRVSNDLCLSREPQVVHRCRLKVIFNTLKHLEGSCLRCQMEKINSVISLFKSCLDIWQDRTSVI